LCKVSWNLLECVFLLELDFAMASILNYNQLIKQYSQIMIQDLVVIKVVAAKIWSNIFILQVIDK